LSALTKTLITRTVMSASVVMCIWKHCHNCC